MVWKPKEKQLTAEEAIALAKKELAPYWIGSEPLMAGVKEGAQFAAHPLSTAFSEKSWIVLFADPTTYGGEWAILVAREWHRRFSIHGVSAILILEFPYRLLNYGKLLPLLIKKYALQFPVAYDADQSLAGAFRVTQMPKAVLISQKQTIFECTGAEQFPDGESEIHKFLRSTDPGLPLLPIYRMSGRIAEDTGRVELGRGRGAQFPKPGFSFPQVDEDTEAPPLGTGVFAAARPATLGAGMIHLTGTWMQDGDRIGTSDPRATLGFRAPSERVSILAESLGKINSTSKVAVELDGEPTDDTVASDQLVMDDEGQASLRVESSQLYHILNALPPEQREVTLRFPSADRVPVVIYGLRFGK